MPAIDRLVRLRHCSESRTSDPRRAAGEALLQLFLVVRASSRAPRTSRSARGTGSAAAAPDARCVDSVSFVCVLRSFATQPMSPAWSSGTSMRSLPCAMREVVQLLDAVARGVVDLLPVGDACPRRCGRYDTSPTCGSDVRLEHERGERARRRSAWISTVVSPSAPLNAWISSISYAIGMSSHDLGEQRLRCRRSARTRRRRAGRAPPRFIASFIPWIASSRPISPPSR